MQKFKYVHIALNLWRKSQSGSNSKKIRHSPDPVQSKSSPMLISGFYSVSFKILCVLVERDPMLLQKQEGFWHGRSTADQVTLLTQDIKMGLCLSISQQPATLHGITASPASYCDFYLTETGSGWSWKWLAIAASPLPPVTTNGAGCDTSKTASHRDPSWHLFFSTSTPLTCQPPSPDSMHTPTI